MNDRELAAALYEAGLLTREQIQDAATHRSAGRGFAQIVTERGWLSVAQIEAVDPMAFQEQPFPYAAPQTPQEVKPAPTASFPDDAFAQPTYPYPPAQVQAPPPYSMPPPIPSPTIQPAYAPYTPANYETFDSSRMILYGIIGALCCQCVGLLVIIQSAMALSKINSGRIDPKHQGNLIAAIIISSAGFIVAGLVRVYFRLNR
jgi:hypothetical protein